MKTTDKYCDFAKSEIQTATVDFSNKSMQNSAFFLCMSMNYQAFCPYLDFSRATRILRVLVVLPEFRKYRNLLYLVSHKYIFCNKGKYSSKVKLIANNLTFVVYISPAPIPLLLVHALYKKILFNSQAIFIVGLGPVQMEIVA